MLLEYGRYVFGFFNSIDINNLLSSNIVSSLPSRGVNHMMCLTFDFAFLLFICRFLRP